MKTFPFFHIRKMSLRSLFTVAILVLCSLSFLLIKRISSMSQAADCVNHTNMVRLSLAKTLSRLNDAEANQRGFILSGDSIFLRNYNKSGQRLKVHLSNLRLLINDNPAQVKQLDTLKHLVNNRLNLLQTVMANHKSAAASGQELQVDLLTGNLSMEAVKARLMLMDSFELQLLEKRTENSKRFVVTTPLFAILLSSAAFLIILFAFYKLNRLLNLSNRSERQAKNEAKKAFALLENAEQIAGIASWEWNVSTQKSEHSRNHYLLLGYEPGCMEPGMNTFLPLIDEVDRNNLLKKQEQSRTNGLTQCTSHFWATRKDGVRRYFKCISHFSKNDKGEDIITGTTQDITEEYLLKQESQQRAYLLEQVVEHNGDLIGVMDTELRILLWNKAYEDAFGLPKEKVLGKKLTDVFPYIENDIKIGLVKEALYGKETKRKELTFLKNQRTGEISFIPIKDANGNIEGVLSIIHDITEFKQSAQLLKVSNIKFEQAEEAGHLGSYRWNAQTGEAAVSNNLYRLLGLEPGSVPPSIDLFFEMLHPDDKQRIIETIQENLARGVFSPVHCRIIRKDGEVRQIKASAIPIANERGETILFGSFADITEEELLKQQLQQRTDLAESVIENSNNLISVIDTDMRYTIWNKANEKATGLTKKEVIGKRMLDVFPELAGHPNIAYIKEGMAGKPSYGIASHGGKRNVIAEISHIPLHDNDGKVTGLLIIMHDVTKITKVARQLEKANTELQLRNKALQEANDLNRHITELAPNGIYVYDSSKASAVYMNKKMQELHGYSEKELIEMEAELMNNLVHPDDLPLLYEKLQGFTKATDEDVIELEYRMRNKEGQYRDVICREAIFKRNENGVPEQFIGVAIDVTDLKRAEKELKEKNRELLQTNEELASFNYIASHDLQEPLRKIQTFSNYLEQTEKGLTGQGLNNLKRMQLSAARMRTLINDLLSFSRIDMVKEDKEHVDLNLVLKGAKSSLRASIDEKGARINADELPVVKGVSFQLQQLFENIIGNAVKYCAQGVVPVVNVSCKKVQALNNAASTLQPGSTYYHICFKDNGIGFEQQYATKIFELFQRLHTRNEFPGTGLGLAICKKIVQNHGGHIQASSKLGEGSVFDLYLPVAEVMENNMIEK
jgi:PAS domain S-box-containing protein